ncbi:MULTISPECIES: DUF6479 family protein [unclassified Kitasatospora]|uniref:DUF6479 family protein n=1 Tax=unclassified Kitasatospora TaxID=2633591 RepID=UPI002E301D0C|nr:DUF6479 family protein [Kitasatospora sp. NBC_01246]
MAVIDLTRTTPLAADGAGAHLWLIAVGVLLVVALMLAFVLGQRRKDREPPPVDLSGARESDPRRQPPPG